MYCQVDNDVDVSGLNKLTIVDNSAPRTINVYRNCYQFSDCNSTICSDSSLTHVSGTDCGYCGTVTTSNRLTGVNIYYNNSDTWLFLELGGTQVPLQFIAPGNVFFCQDNFCQQNLRFAECEQYTDCYNCSSHSDCGFCDGECIPAVNGIPEITTAQCR